ncbi:MAG: restriction endonuclease subunit S, partial [Gammaproteobacteria bacterium]|nr:restriction endonuclease subunit S [Gammaproteobacteria bacterium]
MNAERLIEIYDRVADAPDAVPHLRQFILDLAVRGKLVEQNPNDEPVTELLNRIDCEKGKLEKQIKTKKYPQDNIVEPKFNVPTTWEWVSLCQIGWIVGGGTPRTSEANNFAHPDSGIAWITPTDLGKLTGLFIDRGDRDITEKGLHDSSARISPTGSILFSCRAPIGYVAISSNPVSTNQGIKTLVPYISGLSQYVAYVLSHFAVDIDASAPGTTYRELSGKLFARVLIPLPPLAEQNRIVDKINDLIALCDEIEASRNKRESIRAKLTVSSLGKLVDFKSSEEEFRNHAGFVIDNISSLTVNTEQIRQLRKTILQLATSGKLVEQNPNEEPASELLERIKAEKSRFQSHVVRKKKASSESPVNKIPFSLPSSWTWVSIETVFLYDAGIKRDPKTLDPYFWLLELQDIEKDTGRLIKKVMSKDRTSKSTKSEFRTGDILYGKLRPYLNKVLVA